MKVTIYDKVAWPGFMQWCLKTSWLLGCIFQKLVGAVDEYYGASSWADAQAWLKSRGSPIEQVQYWGHGSPGTVWLAGQAVPTAAWLSLKPLLAPNALIWFRVCDSFQGAAGQAFSKALADGLGCMIAGHTRIIGLWQGGLYTRAPWMPASWDVTEGGEPSWIREDLNPFHKHTILCLKTKIPKGW